MTKANVVSAKNVLGIDIGNSDIKFLINGRLGTLPSSYRSRYGLDKLALSGVEAPYAGFSVLDRNNNPVEEQFTFLPLGGNRLLGDGDKDALYRTIVQGCCGSVDNGKDWIVIASYWNRAKLDVIKQSLLGTHTVVVNGKDREFTIKDAIVVPEGEGANLLYRKEGSGNLVTVDIGFNTLIFRLNGPSGLLTHDVLPESGVRDIIATLEESSALRSLCGFSPDSQAIISAFKNNGFIRSNEKAVPDIDINDLIKASVASWMKGPFQKLLRRNRSSISGASATWIIGGGANLLRERAEGTNLFIPEDPAITNLLGMATLAE